MTNRGGETEVSEHKQDFSLTKNDDSNKWQQDLAANLWSGQQETCCSGGAHQHESASLASNDWLADRAANRIKELATQYGLDPDKSNMQDVIKARAEQGTQLNEGRVDRLRQAEAIKYGLDPEKADWTQINIARVDARKRELGMN